MQHNFTIFDSLSLSLSDMCRPAILSIQALFHLLSVLLNISISDQLRPTTTTAAVAALISVHSAWYRCGCAVEPV